MATNRKLGGYVWRQEINRGRRAVSRARRAAERLKTEDAPPAAKMALLSDILLALLEINETYIELNKIGRGDNDQPVCAGASP